MRELCPVCTLPVLRVFNGCNCTCLCLNLSGFLYVEILVTLRSFKWFLNIFPRTDGAITLYYFFDLKH
jgi:hypothetical protein